jgi:hypothetical protein
MYGAAVVCWDWLKALLPLVLQEAFANLNRQDFRAYALSLSHLTFITTIRIFHLVGSPSFPV